MSFKINLGNWNSIFAVPTKVAEEKLKLSSASQLRVLLYVLAHNNINLTNQQIGQALSMHEEDVKDDLMYWVNEGILSFSNNEYSPSEENLSENNTKTDILQNSEKSDKKQNINDSDETPLKPYKTIMTRAQKPSHTFIAQLVSRDKTLVDLLNEIQMSLGKTLSNSDTATIVYLYDTCGLSAPVIMMLVQYCITINKPNLRTIERIGIQWADEGVETVIDAENKIKDARQSNLDFSKVSSVFGIHNAGTPSAKQLSYSKKWVSVWKFSDEMLREAYERCLDAKGEMKFSYIDGILKRWYNDGIKNISDIENKQNQSKIISQKKAQPRASRLEQKPSYDINELENMSFLDDN